MEKPTNIHVLRAKFKHSQNKLAKAVGLSRQTINKTENDRHELSVKNALRIAMYYNTTVEYLFKKE